MTTKSERLQKLFRLYKDETGEKEVDNKAVAEWMIQRGVPAPKPKTPVELLASEISSALREETRYDNQTGRPYRANHAVPTEQGVFWIDIDENPSRSIMNKSLMKRRQQMVADGLHLTLDADHWNSANPDQEPIQIPLDFELDIEIEKAKKDQIAA
jgi:hypothetical protein